MTVNIITLGCSKNIVDSEVLAARLQRMGHRVFFEGTMKSDIVILNTCSFIGDAREESVNEILVQVDRKMRRHIKKLYVVGCLAQRCKAELEAELPEVDGFYSFADLHKMVDANEFDLLGTSERLLSTPPHYAYLKVSEGCDHQCSYCAIPLIRGKQVSKPIPLLVEEVRKLADQGVKEVMLIAQDLTYYGLDLTGKRELANLMEALAQVRGIEWYRLHYAYPLNFPYEILDVMNAYPQFCRYLDIPFQHISDDILKDMRRGGGSQYIYDLIARIRETVPGIALRTTLISGYPTETLEQHKELVEFVRRNRFERLGVFAYSQEEDTPAYPLGDPIRRNIKTRRVGKIMQLQESISRELNEAKVGQTLKVIIDSEEGEHYVGRTEFDSPDVDNSVLVTKEKPLTIGEFYPVTITEATEYDLYGTLT
ncbi:MAG: 30S ribosomal protein S12 methylthiotransferase RimO [Bacteroidales bacterium]|nr:30S ribosomal protein S12 methylthiotransferase RimO [Bacteroidales bacterium]MBR6161156.1 30S ribosomal protein S12 methylthiotransferase RimO [Bacteroidales bacterium]